ncbi:MAG: glycine cleavage system protein H [Flavobacterium sp.]
MIFIPKGLNYTKNHLWLRKIGSCDFYVGLTDYMQKEIGKIDVIEIDQKGINMQKGKTWGIVYGLNQKFSLIAPLDCYVLAINPVLEQKASLVNTDPYNHWFLRVALRTANDYFLSNLEYLKLIK